MSVLLYKNYAGVQFDKLDIVKEAFKKRTYWYDIYMDSKKIGFAMTSFEKAGDEIIIKHDREMKLSQGDGGEKVLVTSLNCLSDSLYSIKSFRYSASYKGEKGIKVSGEVSEDEIIFFLESREMKKTYSVSTGGRDVYLPVVLIPLMHLKDPDPAAPVLVPVLSVTNASINDVKMVLKEIRPVKVGTNSQNLYQFRVGDSIIWGNENGVVIKEILPTGITLYYQHEELAKESTEKVLFDYISSPFLKSDKIVSDAENLNLFRIKISGFRPDPLIYEDSPVSINKNIITIKKVTIEELKEKIYELPYREPEQNYYILPDEWIRSDYKPLKDTGRIYAKAQNSDAFLLAQYLTGYVFNLIKVSAMPILSDSRDVFKTLSGDHLGKAVMFATYARAGGLPTRLVGGFVYLNGYFYFHVWPEVWLDKWVPADPTFYQFPADVTHVPLKVGTLEEITSIIKNLKNVKIEILEAS